MNYQEKYLKYKEKYLKYKQKYLDFKNQEGGVKSLLYSAFVTILNNDPDTGDKAPITNINMLLERYEQYIEIFKDDVATYSILTNPKLLTEFFNELKKDIDSTEQINIIVRLKNHGLICENLTFKHTFNEPIDALSELFNLEYLTFGVDFNQPIEALSRLVKLKNLTLGASFNQPLDGLSELNLKNLSLGRDFNQPSSLLRLVNLEHLIFLRPNYFNENQETQLLRALPQLRITRF
jgi:hypothetical protein